MGTEALRQGAGGSGTTVNCYTWDSDDRHKFPPMSPEEVRRWKFYTASDGHLVTNQATVSQLNSH